jgi:DNA-binding CsgD family transcriptional regulator
VRVIGREAELAVVGDLLKAIRVGPAGKVLEGPPGIGKTAILKATVDLAVARSYDVLSCRPAQSEARLSYTAIADLLSRMPSGVFSEIPSPQRRALEVALLRAEPGSGRLEHRAVSAGFLSVVTHLARSGPVLLAVDDVQWLDRPSARVLEFAIRRFESIRVGVLATVRTEDRNNAPVGLDRAFLESGFTRHDIGPLSLGALHQLIRERFGHVFPRPQLVRIERASSGNPLFALETARAIMTSGPGEALGPLPVPESLQGLISGRLEKLPARSRELLLLASAMSQPTIPLMERATGREGQAGAELRAAANAEVIDIEGGRVVFTHPLLAAALYWGIRADERRVLHRRLAAVQIDAEERARHLALGADGPDAIVADALENAALRAKAQGAPDSAAELADLARRLTPPERLDDSTRRGLGAADALLAIGEVTRAREMLEADLERDLAGPARAEILLRLSYFVPGGFHAAERLLTEALADASDRTPLRVQILKELSIVRFIRGDLPGATDDAERAVREAEALKAPGLLASVLIVLADRLFFMGRGMRRDLVERALRLEDEEGGEVHQDAYRSPTARAGRLQMYAGDVEAARPGLEAAYRRAVERGDEESRRSLCTHLVELECRAGRFIVAMRYATEGSELAESAGHPRIGANLYARALVETYLGKTREALHDAERALAASEGIGDRPFTVFNLYALGFLSLSVGDPAEADRHLRKAVRLHADMGFADYGVAPYLPDEIEALVALGDLETAETFLVRLEEQGRALDRPWALATAARCRGLLRAGSADLDGANAALEEALLHHERLAMPFELGRTLLVLGQVQRRRNERRTAKRTLERAVAIFDELGTPLWADRAKAELDRLGLRRPGGLELTPTEERIASLAATGLTNREVAERLLISPKTVEANLARAYRKLGIRSRAALGATMATRAGRATRSPPQAGGIPTDT